VILIIVIFLFIVAYKGGGTGGSFILSTAVSLSLRLRTEEGDWFTFE